MESIKYCKILVLSRNKIIKYFKFSDAQTLRSVMIENYVDITEYRVPTTDQLDAAESMFASLLQSGTKFSSSDISDWFSLGFHLREVNDSSNTRFAVVSEFTPSHGTGQGFYAIKLRQPSEQRSGKILQAPHRPSDLYTHEIICDILTSVLISHNYDAGGWSTTHRNNVDLCKEPSSYFNSFTTAVGKSYSKAKIVQLHGFAKASHNNTEADIIFSSTKKEMPSTFFPMATCLKTSLTHFVTMKYPEEVDFLGGTLNINAAKFYQVDNDNMFFHVETSKELRDQLRVNATLRNEFSECF